MVPVFPAAERFTRAAEAISAPAALLSSEFTSNA
jgi:hypothetical protein